MTTNHTYSRLRKRYSRYPENRSSPQSAVRMLSSFRNRLCPEILSSTRIQNLDSITCWNSHVKHSVSAHTLTWHVVSNKKKKTGDVSGRLPTSRVPRGGLAKSMTFQSGVSRRWTGKSWTAFPFSSSCKDVADKTRWIIPLKLLEGSESWLPCNASIALLNCVALDYYTEISGGLWILIAVQY
jgi:hypothetical protein